MVDLLFLRVALWSDILRELALFLLFDFECEDLGKEWLCVAE